MVVKNTRYTAKGQTICSQVSCSKKPLATKIEFGWSGFVRLGTEFSVHLDVISCRFWCSSKLLVLSQVTIPTLLTDRYIGSGLSYDSLKQYLTLLHHKAFLKQDNASPCNTSWWTPEIIKCYLVQGLTLQPEYL